MRTSFHHQSEAQPLNGPLTAATSPDTPSLRYGLCGWENARHSGGLDRRLPVSELRRHFQINDLGIGLKPLRKGGPPTWLAAVKRAAGASTSSRRGRSRSSSRSKSS